MDDPEVINEVWQVRMVVPKDQTKARSYDRNVYLCVVCRTAREAIETADAKWPEASLRSIQHGGHVHHIV